MFPSWSWAGWVSSFRYLHWTDHLLDDLSRVQWQDANTGQFFTSDELRSPKDGPIFKYNDSEEREDDWIPCRTRERFIYDVPYWYESTNPKMWCLHPTAPEAERTLRTFIRPGSQTLRFKALTAFFQLSFSSTWSRLPETTPLQTVGILDRDNFRAGTIHIHKDLLPQLKLGRPSSARGKTTQQPSFELICLSRRRASEWDSTFNNVYDTKPYHSPQPSDDFKNIPDQPTLYPHQKTPEDANNGFDHRRYNVHIPFPLYNVMLIARNDGVGDGVAERLAHWHDSRHGFLASEAGVEADRVGLMKRLRGRTLFLVAYGSCVVVLVRLRKRPALCTLVQHGSYDVKLYSSRS